MTKTKPSEFALCVLRGTRDIWDESEPHMATEEMLVRLNALEGEPWSGSGLTVAALNAALNEFGIEEGEIPA